MTWTDKGLYWAGGGNESSPPPYEKAVEYASVCYPHTAMHIAKSYVVDGIRVPVNAEEIEWHKRNGAEVS